MLEYFFKKKYHVWNSLQMQLIKLSIESQFIKS